MTDAADAIAQQKLVKDGQLRRWTVDIAAMAACARWARSRAPELADELRRLLQAFPTLIAALGRPLDDDRCWVEAAEPVTCPDCSGLVTFDRGVRCADCQRSIEPPRATVVGLVGRLPALISGRPFVASLDRRLGELRRRQAAVARLWERAMLLVDGKRYLAPRYGLWFAESWPHSDPPVMVWGEYFEMLDIPPDHVYYADQYYRLCLYATWREQPAVRVLHNRVVPRLLIDLMVADLQAEQQLETALQRLDLTLYQLYNTLGRPREAEAFRRVYQELIRT